jgi:D-cysteine desulfhydrase
MRIEKLNLDFLGIKQNVFIYRDDLFPYYYGGNKARKILFEKQQILKSKSKAVITTGGIQSNHCRVTALLCAELGIECHLVLHGNEQHFHGQAGNASIMKVTGAFTYFVDGNEIGPAMDRLMLEFTERGKSPYYLYGGGHTKQGFLSYVNATEELVQSKVFSQFNIQSIYLASGTGSTQAGIIQGVANSHSENKVYGISIARTHSRGFEAIKESLAFSNESKQVETIGINFNDEYLCGGYGQTNKDLQGFLKQLITNTGILFDGTYSGKAFYGMIQELEKSNNKENVLFWHTGGQFNYLI